MNSWMSKFMQDSVSPIMEQLMLFHDHAMMIVMMITVMVGYIIITIFMNKLTSRLMLENQTIELIWTLMPALTLIFIALPSLRILYLIEESLKPILTIKVIGHQWYWSYEYSDFNEIEFESYMMPSNNLGLSDFRLLDTDNRMIIPFNTMIRILTSSSDVIHSWTIPSVGIKIDASPGRINQGNMIVNRPGIFFGQCSEICGSNHSFMPISMESVNMKSFMNWINKK
uniref:Cytochrome c oxidase subunit 2 n=2 Tax=Membracidae TaxID=30095 RepID=A0A5B9T3W3_9HEMI|nr:cytochrome c oxidase subunit II [Maurya qinlingensis]YP_010963538.1 cytochrome c oxidase subunit II [Antialcidas trifoliaceus]QEG98447.1 cytochrome c oxidase subunit II [Maurya qinlingensis]WKZ08021.1 cytochrome c oxidase subunit II [Antialcidas trifoliaceus]